MSRRRLWTVVLLSVLTASSGLQVKIPQSTYEAAQDDEVAITCSFQPKNPVNPLVIITWTGDPDESFDDEGISFGTFYSNNDLTDVDPAYEGKAQIQSDVNARVSKLVLKRVTLRESRRIRCRVQIPGDSEGQTADTTALVVLVAPSNPVCKIKGAANYGQNINLTCISEEGSPLPVYQWQGYNVQNVQRPFPPKTTEKDGLLSLFNVSKETSGYYICTSTNKIRSAQCNLTLSVMPATMNVGATAGIIGGAVAGVAVLVLIIYCCCRKKEKPEEFDMGPPVIEYQDIPKKEERGEALTELRKTSFEGAIDQNERYDVSLKTNSNLKGNTDADSHREDERRQRNNDQRDDNFSRYSDDDRRDHYEDHQEHYDDRSGRYDDRQERRDDRRARYVDRQEGRDDRRDCYDDRQEGRDDRRDRYDDRQEGRDDRRDRYDDRQERRDDRRDRYDDRQERRVDRRDRYDDRQERHDDRQERYVDRRDRVDDGRDRYDGHGREGYERGRYAD